MYSEENEVNFKELSTNLIRVLTKLMSECPELPNVRNNIDRLITTAGDIKLLSTNPTLLPSSLIQNFLENLKAFYENNKDLFKPAENPDVLDYNMTDYNVIQFRQSTNKDFSVDDARSIFQLGYYLELMRQKVGMEFKPPVEKKIKLESKAPTIQSKSTEINLETLKAICNTLNLIAPTFNQTDFFQAFKKAASHLSELLPDEIVNDSVLEFSTNSKDQYQMLVKQNGYAEIDAVAKYALVIASLYQIEVTYLLFVGENNTPKYYKATPFGLEAQSIDDIQISSFSENAVFMCAFLNGNQAAWVPLTSMSHESNLTATGASQLNHIEMQEQLTTLLYELASNSTINKSRVNSILKLLKDACFNFGVKAVKEIVQTTFDNVFPPENNKYTRNDLFLVLGKLGLQTHPLEEINNLYNLLILIDSSKESENRVSKEIGNVLISKFPQILKSDITETEIFSLELAIIEGNMLKIAQKLYALYKSNTSEPSYEAFLTILTGILQSGSNDQQAFIEFVTDTKNKMQIMDPTNPALSEAPQGLWFLRGGNDPVNGNSLGSGPGNN